MDHELAFSAAGLLSMTGWLTLIASPYIPVWSNRIAGSLVPVALSGGYLMVVLGSSSGEGGFGTFAEVQTLFSDPDALLAGWIHFLAFDLFVGAWACRIAREEGMRFLWVLPCLPLIFLLGPAGFLVFNALRSLHHHRRKSASNT